MRMGEAFYQGTAKAIRRWLGLDRPNVVPVAGRPL
jgi:hypothetical protein